MIERNACIWGLEYPASAPKIRQFQLVYGTHEEVEDGNYRKEVCRICQRVLHQVFDHEEKYGKKKGYYPKCNGVDLEKMPQGREIVIEISVESC